MKNYILLINFNTIEEDKISILFNQFLNLDAISLKFENFKNIFESYEEDVKEYKI